MSSAEQVGAVVIGGEHPGLGVARSLGRRGIPVFVIDDQRCISAFSRYTTGFARVKNLRDEEQTVSAVLEVGRKENLRNWVLFPTRDETVAAFSRYRDELAMFYRVTTPAWDVIRWMWDKKNTYEMATRLDIPCPKTFNVSHAKELDALYDRLPLAVKPAVKENFFYATGAKAWRADTPEQLQELWVKAARQISVQEILLQEIIPGDGRHQVSYCAFYRNGEEHSTLVAMRARQHPREFGRAASYVETVELPEIEELSYRFLHPLKYHGLVEIEFKRDPRDGRYKLLDVNARTWGFHTLGLAAGVDFPYLVYADQVSDLGAGCHSRPGIGWLRWITDVPTAFRDIAQGYLPWSSYVETLRKTKIESVFCSNDPCPSMAEIALLPYLVAKKYL